MSKLGNKVNYPSKKIVSFVNPNLKRDYIIKINTNEFSCVCPKTGQPDFATIKLKYIADKLCIELKSFKLYLWSFRNQGSFHEAVTNQILDDLVAAIQPRYMVLIMEFNVRGGIHTTIVAKYISDNWQLKK